MSAVSVGLWFGPAGRKKAIRALRLRVVARLNHTPLLRAVFGVLRRAAPVLKVGKAVVVTRHDDVVEVFDREDDFTIAELNATVMDRVNGPFILGMDRSEQYEREDALPEHCVRPGDLDRIREIVRRSAAELVEDARADGRIDVVNGLARRTAVRVVGASFVVPGPD